MHVTALLRDGQGLAALNVPLTMVVERPDGVEYRRTVVADQGVGGRALPVPLVASAPTGTWRVKAYTDPKRPPVGEATFMVEDYMPDRLEFELASKAKGVSKTTTADVTVDGRFLYGAPAAGLDLEGEVVVMPAKERAGFPRYEFGLTDEDVEIARAPLENLPDTDTSGKATFAVTLDKQPTTSRPLEAVVTVRMAESGGRAVERKLTLPVIPGGPMIGVKPLFSGRSLGEGENATFDVVVAAPDGTSIERKALRYELLKIDTKYQYYRRDGVWDFEPVKSTKRVADGTVDVAAAKPGRISVPVQWGRYRLEVSTGERNGPITSIGFDAGWYAEANADTPDLLEIALDKPEYAPGDSMTVAVTARTAGKVTLNVIGDRLITTVSQDVTPGTARLRVPVGSDWGSGAYVLATLRRPLDAQAERMPGRAIGVQWFSVNRKARTLALDLGLPTMVKPNSALRIPVKVSGSIPARRRASSSPPSTSASSTSPTTSRRRPMIIISASAGSPPMSVTSTASSSTACRARAARSGPAATPAARACRLAAHAEAARALFRHRHGQARRHRGVEFDIPDFAGTARVMAVAWSKDKVGRASATSPSATPSCVTRRCRAFCSTAIAAPCISSSTMSRAGRRLSPRGEERRLTCRHAAPQTFGSTPSSAAPWRCRCRPGGRQRHCHGAGQRTRRLRGRAQLRARGAAGHADPGAPHGQATGQGRKPDAVERSPL
jgi:uncharacterized protein YfaS (alpha-2-macroglobulin family)